jgi:splicing factor 3B subunit 1
MGMKTPAVPLGSMTPEQMAVFRWEKDIDDRNRPLSDEELDALVPPGYKVSNRET